MASPNARSLVLGFIHVRRVGSDSFRAGYLLTTDYGRPVEFHYTSELVVPRLQQHLFGNRFEPTLYADTLAKPMTDRQGTAPQIIVVDHPALMELRTRIPAPVVLLLASEPASTTAEVDAHPDFARDKATFEKIRGVVPPGFRWSEPFERIEAALAEVKEPSTTLSAA